MLVLDRSCRLLVRSSRDSTRRGRPGGCAPRRLQRSPAAARNVPAGVAYGDAHRRAAAGRHPPAPDRRGHDDRRGLGGGQGRPAAQPGGAGPGPPRPGPAAATHLVDGDGRALPGGSRPRPASPRSWSPPGPPGCPRGGADRRGHRGVGARGVRRPGADPRTAGSAACRARRRRPRDPGALLARASRSPSTTASRSSGSAAEQDATLVSLVPTMLARCSTPTRGRGALARPCSAGPGRWPSCARGGGVAVVTTYGMTETFGGVVLDRRPCPASRSARRPTASCSCAARW